jgi:hypothetical protein
VKHRSRRVAAVSATLLVATVAATGWMAWRRPSAQAPPLGVTLLVNHGSHVEVTPGTPLVFEVSITSSASSASVSIGSRWRSWHRLIRLEASGRAGMPWALSSGGPPRSLSVVPTTDGRPDIRTETNVPPIAHFERGQQVYTITEVASPEAAAGVPPGAYRVRAVVETPAWMLWGWRGRALSQPVTIVVRDPSRAGDKRESLEKQRLARVAGFYIAAARFTEAEGTARQLLAVEPEQSRSHILLGDALAGLKRRQEALAAYRRAMALLPRSYDAPTVLMDRIRRVVDGT